jgi:hypothetical protein
MLTSASTCMSRLRVDDDGGKQSWLHPRAVDRFPTNDRRGGSDHAELIGGEAVSTGSGAVQAGQTRQWIPGRRHCQHVQCNVPAEAQLLTNSKQAIVHLLLKKHTLDPNDPTNLPLI